MARLEIAPMPQLHWLTLERWATREPCWLWSCSPYSKRPHGTGTDRRFQLSRASRNGNLKTWGYFPHRLDHFMWLVAGSRNHKPCVRLCTQDPNGLWTLRLQTCDPIMSWYSAMSCIHLTSQQLFSFGAMIVFLLCNRPAVYIYRFEMRRKIDEKDENRCFFPKNA